MNAKTVKTLVMLVTMLAVLLLVSVMQSDARETVTQQAPPKPSVDPLTSAESVVVENAELVLPDSMSGTHLEPASVVMNENFEGAWPSAGWRLSDLSTQDGGQFFWGKRTCWRRSGVYGGWSVGGGAQGGVLSCSSSYPNFTDTWAVYGPFNLSGASAATLTYHYYGRTEGGSGCPYDYLYVGSSVDGANFSGSRRCGAYTAGSFGNGFYQATLDLSSRLGQSQVWVAFSFVSDLSITDSGITIDDVTLDVVSPPTPTPTSTPGCVSTPTPLPTNVATPQPSGSMQLRVAHCMDDAYALASSNELVYDARLVRMGAREGGMVPYVMGLLFRNVRVPRGAQITSAQLVLEPWGFQNGMPIDVQIVGDLRPQSDDFNPANLRPHLRPRTVSSVRWLIAGNVSSTTQSPDIASVVAEIVNQAGWQPGNNLAILVAYSPDSRYYIDWQAYEYIPANAVRLELSYLPAIPTPTPTSTPTSTRPPTPTPTPTRTPGPTTRRAYMPVIQRLVAPTPTATPTRPCANDPYEPNGSFAEAWGPLSLNQDFQGYFNCLSDTDRDYYFFDLTTSRRIVITLRNVAAGSDYDLTLYSCPASTCMVRHSGNPGNADEVIDTTVSAGRYYVRVSRSATSPLVTQPYRLRVATP